MSKSEEEELCQRKYEEALEVKSLRRIISAYLNYPEAAEEDLKRYERSFRRLPATHQALLSHLPSKLHRLRRCILKNSSFILEMLKAFEPPLDMSQGIDICEQHLWTVSENSLFSGERILCSCESDPTSKRVYYPKSDGAGSEEEGNVMLKSHKERVEHFNESNTGSCFVGSECNTKADESGVYVVKNAKNQETPYSITDSNGNVSTSPPDWLVPSFQFHVPLVDVDKEKGMCSGGATKLMRNRGVDEKRWRNLMSSGGLMRQRGRWRNEVRCIIRNIVRDWAAEGQRERDQCYTPILEELKRQFPDRCKERRPACLVPGAGLGRLALEISCLGFISQGNEFSYYMMICSSFILNHTQSAEEWTIHPWIHSNCNSLSDSDQLRPISVPDIHPASAGIAEGFSMCGGDFVEVYSDPSQVGVWDAIVTCFFLDTAHNIVEYIEIISRILKDEGIWINLGPLLYHFADMYGEEDEMSIELCLEDVKKVACHYGFQLENEKIIETTYTTNPRSMMQNHYYAAFWTMRKKTTATEMQSKA